MRSRRHGVADHFGTEVVVINRTEDSTPVAHGGLSSNGENPQDRTGLTFEEDLATDVLEIITVFSAQLYGSRSHKNKKIVEELREVATRI